MALVAVAVVAGCANGDSEGSGAAADRPDASSPERLDPLDPAETPTTVLPEGFTRKTERGLWRLAEVDPDDRTITVVAANGSCLHLSHLTVESVTGDKVELAAWNDSWEPGPGYGCTMELRYERRRFRLPEPLGGRDIEGQCEPGDGSVAARQCPDDFFLSPPTTTPG